MCNCLTAIPQAMQYASPKAVWNMLFGVTQPPLEYKDGNELIVNSITIQLYALLFLNLKLLF